MFNDNVIKAGTSNCVPASLFRSTITKEEIMENIHLNKELQLMSGQQTILHLISCLKELLGKEPAFAGAAVQMQSLPSRVCLKPIAMQMRKYFRLLRSVGVALTNACTTNAAQIKWASDDERIFDYQIRDFLKIEDEDGRG